MKIIAIILLVLSGACVSIDGGISTAYTTGDPLIALGGFGGSTFPSGYLNYILFDENYVPIRAKSFPVQNLPSTRHTVQFDVPLEVKELGYLFVYLSYDNNSNLYLYFDDLKVIVDESPVIQVNNYYPFGMISNTWLREGEIDNAKLFQGKELIAQTGCLPAVASAKAGHDFGSRMYWADLGRWFSTDPQKQFSSPYVGMGNMPAMGRDPDGELFVIDDILIGMAVGALIGGGTSGAVYALSTWASGKEFNGGDFWNSVALGAIGGAIGGGIGGAFKGSVFAQTVGFNILSNSTSTVAGTAIMGGDITPGTFVGSLAGGLVSSAFPGFTGVKGGALKNFGAELGYNSARGAIAGSVTGGMSAMVDGGDALDGFREGLVNGAVGGAASTTLMVATFGAAIVPEKSVRDRIEKYEKHFGSIGYKNRPPVFRRGGIYGAIIPRGVTWGRNLVVPDGDSDTYVHELIHYYQQIRDGWAYSQGKGIFEILYLETIRKISPYYKKETNEYEASQVSEFFR